MSGSQDKVSTGTLNAIFENLMQVSWKLEAMLVSICLYYLKPQYFQDVERKTSVVSRGPPANIYSCD